jgi:hypothetical protein
MHRLILVILLSNGFSTAIAEDRDVEKNWLFPASKPSKSLVISKKTSAWAAKYKNTKCLNFTTQQNRAKEIGLVCKSSNQEFLKDTGVIFKKVQEESLQNNDGNFKVFTAVAEYPMELFLDTKPPVYSAIVDCDEVNSKIYRAASSCHIAFRLLEDKSFIYSNFTLKNNQKNITYVSIQEIEKLWHKIGS